MNPKSIYIHIPFCKNICAYCDFCKMYYNQKWINSYLKELNEEIKLKYQNNLIKTIYVGGGTPSSLTINELNTFFSYLKQIKLAQNYEFTFECNIENINEKLLKKLKENKVNRISIGVQSFNKNILKSIGRTANINIKEKIELAKKYFKNINIDLIYGINNQTINDLKDDLKKYLELNIPHISIYSLILEQNTILSSQNYKELDEDKIREMYDLICKELKKNGYNHYEISNFSKKGYESKHNICYWNNERYYGFGLGASGYINNIRYTNTKSINNYLNKKYVYEEEQLSHKETMENEMILNLRKIKGINKNTFYKKYNTNINDVFNTEKLKENKYYYYIDEKDLFISNSILIDFIDI